MSYEDHLLQRATLQKATITRDAATGDEVEVWTTVATDVPCYARVLSGRSDIPLGLLESVSHKVNTLYRTDVSAGRWRMLIAGVEYRIAGVVDPGIRGHHLELWARRMND